jgi:hypothetical protein
MDVALMRDRLHNPKQSYWSADAFTKSMKARSGAGTRHRPG